MLKNVRGLPHLPRQPPLVIGIRFASLRPIAGLVVLAFLISSCGQSASSSRRPNSPPAAFIPGKPPPVEEVFHGCQPWGSGGEDPFINQLKNRIDRPAHPVTMTFAQLEHLEWPPGVVDVPTAKWSASDRATVFRSDGLPVSFIGYFSSVDSAGAEPTNCGTGAGVDWHLWLGSLPHAPHTSTFIAESTGRVRAREAGFDLAQLAAFAARGTLVRVSGWLMLDTEHPEVPSHRATIWEIHPVTRIDAWNGGRWTRVAG